MLTMIVACLLVRHLPVHVELCADPALARQPLVVGGRPWDPGAVLDCCPRAVAAGVRPGMRLAQAETLCPTARFIPSREHVYREAHDILIATAQHSAPALETAGLGLIYAEATGLRRLFGPETELARKLAAEATRDARLPVQVGLAGTKFVAEQAAAAARPGGGCVVPAGEERAFLSPLPLSVLPIDLEIARRLEMLGVHTLGALASLPRLAVIRQFGAHAGPLHDLASGIDPRPVQPDAPPLAIQAQRTWEEPLANQQAVSVHLQQMAAEIGEKLTRQGYQAEGLRLALVDRREHRHAAGIAVKPPSAEGTKLARLAQQVMEEHKLAEAARLVAAIALITYPLRPAHLGAVQPGLFGNTQDRRLRQLREVLRGLRTRFGELVVVVAALIAPPPPCPIQVTFGLQGLPRALVWHDRIHQVSAVYECWRERRRWWGTPVERDYYRLETTSGEIKLIFHDLREGQWLMERRHP
jgi:DNA polymerase-4